MKLYAICWQDSHEPWGWAPISDDFDNVAGGEREAQPFHWNRGDAEEELERVRQVAEHRDQINRFAIREYLTFIFTRMTLGEVNDYIGGSYSIQEYDVPAPPAPDVGKARVLAAPRRAV